MKHGVKALVAALAFVAGLAFTGVTAQAEDKIADTIKIPQITTKAETGVTKNYSYTDMDTFSSDVSYSGIILPVKVSTPGYVVATVKECSIAETVSVGVYSDSVCTRPVESIAVAPLTIGTTGNIKRDMVFSKTGTYYIKFMSKNEFVEDNVKNYKNSFKINFKEYTSNEKEVKSGKTYPVYNKSDKAILLKFKATKNGKLVIKNEDKGNYSIVLANARKSNISSLVKCNKSNTYSSFFAVEKGKTYYLKLSKITAQNDINISNFKITFKTIADKSGAKKSKSKLAKLGKNTTGTITLSDKDDWYKVQIPKYQKGLLEFTYEGTGSVKITVYSPMGEKIGTCVNKGKKATYSITYDRGNNHSSGKVMNGTYYIKVTKSGRLTNGVYTFKWIK